MYVDYLQNVGLYSLIYNFLLTDLRKTYQYHIISDQKHIQHKVVLLRAYEIKININDVSL